ncbi:MAG: amidase family protein, partial [Actinomycetota bacterium]|nr:amidase family protein [Actinomycetota bacterium]
APAAVGGPDARDSLPLPAPARAFSNAVDLAAPPRRVIWSPTMGFATIDREVLAACEAAVAALADAGTDVVELDTVMSADPLEDWLTMWVVARHKAQGLFMDTPEWEQISPSLRPQITAGASVTGSDHARALDACYRYRAELADAMETADADLVLCPTVAGQAPRLGEEGTIDGNAEVGWVQLTYGINLTRNPAGTVNAGYTAAGMPIGLQVIGRHLDDAGVLAAMRTLETVVSDDRIAGVG